MIISKNYPSPSIYIVNEFNSANETTKSETLLQYFQEVKLFDNRRDAISFARKKKPKTLFIDSDIGLQRHLQLCLFKIINPKSEIHVYEEGIGTYRTDLVPSKLKRYLCKAIGSACYFGDSIAVKKIHVFDTGKYSTNIPQLKKKTLAIPQTMSNFVDKNEENILNIFCKNFKLKTYTDSRDAYLYLSDWKIEEAEIIATKNHKNAFIKPHPHKKECEIKPYRDLAPSAQWIPGVIPAEVILLMLSKRYERVFTRHRNSSAVQYMSHLKNIIET